LDPALPDRFRQAPSGVVRVVNRKELTMQIVSFIQQFARDEEGVTAIEYGLIAALIAIVIIGAVTVVGDRLCATFNTVAEKLGGTAAGCP